jgi:hypothetical protein
MQRKHTPASKFPDYAYERFLKSVKPIGLGLRESSSKLDRDEYVRIRRQKDGGARSISTEYKLLEAASGYFNATGKFSLMVAEKLGANPALKIDCTFETHFHCNGPARKELAERFTSSELRLVLWPYFRELVFDLCGKMSIPPITIPLTTNSEQ